ncbi:DJ-1/PfpI family protein [Rhodococcus sp. BP22]|uniref:DJ-1/PfpI family protein n=1 Tax=Rhodococcus sp. BP22 TaxID=2758566 RepID=UPI0016458BEE|nr:DJ-1/PfpI family protein [Rhodococcus sp. BP22]
MKTIALYALDTMADWEYGYFVAGVAMARQSDPDRYQLAVVSDGSGEVTTAGGIRVLPDGDVADLDVGSLAALVLPGGDTWGEGHAAVLALARTAIERAIPVGAICGATLGLARTGLLNARPHTSNALEFISGATEYTGGEHYRDARVVSDHSLVTAPGTAALQFTKAMFELLELFPEPIIEAWYGLYSTGERKFYDQLVAG